VILLLAGCGAASHGNPPNHNSAPPLPAAPTLHAHPQAIEPVAGGTPSTGSQEGPTPAAASVSVGPSSGPLPQPISDAQVRRELAASGLSANSGQATLTPQGLAIAPADAPAVIQQVIQAGNEIAHLPYRFGGGHGTFIDNAYDCSGSLSFVFAAAGLLNTTMTSGELMNWGQSGLGKWITIYANNGHTFMYVAGLRFDTVALAETGTRWSNRPPDEPDLRTFAIRHPLGL
jgi:cell wall-associated NlpC family hydrolase